MKQTISSLFSTVLASGIVFVSAETIDFSAPAASWSLPAGKARITAETGNTKNKIMLIDTAAPHHTRIEF